MFFTSSGSVAYAANTQAVAEQGRGAIMRLELHYQRGLLDANIVNAPLGKVLHELALKTGTQIRFIDPAIGVWPVSVSVKATALLQGIEKILSGFSYALDHNAEAPTLIMCSTHPTIKGLNIGGAQVARALLRTEPDRVLNTSEATIGALSDEVPREPIPQSLDEFQPIVVQD